MECIDLPVTLFSVGLSRVLIAIPRSRQNKYNIHDWSLERLDEA